MKERTGRHPVRQQAPLPEKRSPKELLKVPGPYVVQWGSHHNPNIEFFTDPALLNRRLEELWGQGRTGQNGAIGRPASWHDVFFYYQRGS